jgi:HSP20 family protein
VQVDKETLRVTGEATIATPEDMEALWAEVRSARYERSFSLSSELDTENISATMKDGVLTVKIPRRAELQPRKVEVRVA